MTLQPVLVTLSYNSEGKMDYNPATSTLLTETCKILISLAFHVRTLEPVTAKLDPLEVFEYAVPAFIFFINNNLVFVILTYIDAPTFQLLGQMKTLFTGLLFRIFLGRELTAHQYLAIWFLTCGTSISQVGSCTETKSSFIGFLLVVVSSLLSAFGGIFNEKLMKTKKGTIHWQNIQLYSWGILFNLVGVILHKRETLVEGRFFDGFNLWACVVVLNNALNGLAISAILKYADNIARVYAHAIAMLVTMIISVLLFGLKPTPQLMIAIAVVGASALQYNMKVDTEYRSVPQRDGSGSKLPSSIELPEKGERNV
jgi:UDP-sugar transporter A1/2/3